jgi:hypothetical protein
MLQGTFSFGLTDPLPILSPFLELVAAAETNYATYAVPIATLVAAIVAASAAVLGGVLQRKSGHEAAKASEKSAEAAQKSADQAKRMVDVTANTAHAAGLRSDAEALSKRYQDAATLLGHNKAAVRLSGVYAMARLADDWADQRQTCIDVLCAYLRTPWNSDPASDLDGDEKQVRGSIISAINRHVTSDAKTSWSSYSFDLRGAHLTDVTLEGCRFTGKVDVRRAVFRGENKLRDIHFHSAAFEGCTFMEHTELQELTSADFAGSVVESNGTLIVITSLAKERWDLTLRRLEVKGRMYLGLWRPYGRSSGSIDMDWVKVEGEVIIREHNSVKVTPKGVYKHEGSVLPSVAAWHWSIEQSGSVKISKELVDDGTVRWETDHNRGTVQFTTETS